MKKSVLAMEVRWGNSPKFEGTDWKLMQAQPIDLGWVTYGDDDQMRKRHTMILEEQSLFPDEDFRWFLQWRLEAIPVAAMTHNEFTLAIRDEVGGDQLE